MSGYRDDPLETGAIYVYERRGTKWSQASSAIIPDEYKRNSSASLAKEARFGWRVDVDNDLIVVGAPEENFNKGSITVFRKKQGVEGGEGGWEQVQRLVPNLCGSEFFGYSVQVHEDVIATSADCDAIILLYEYDRAGNSIALSQSLRYISPTWGSKYNFAVPV